MPVLLWLSLILGYAVGIAAAYFLLPKPILEPLTGRILVASMIMLAGAGMFLLLRRAPPGVSFAEGSAQERFAAAPANEPAAPGAARADNFEGFDDDGCDDLIGDPREIELLDARRDDPLTRGADGSIGAGELRQILYDARVGGLFRPSLALPEAKEAFRHVIPRLHDLAGERLEPASYMRTAARCGLIGVIDRVFVIRTLQRLEAERRSGEVSGVCCNIDGSSLTAPVFTDGLLEFLDDHLELCPHLVLELERLPSERRALEVIARLRARDIRFCLKRLSAAPIDPARIKTAGFDFIRLAAPRYSLLPAMAELLPQLSALQAAADQAGLTIVVDQADTGRTLMADDASPPPGRRPLDELREDAA